MSVLTAKAPQAGAQIKVPTPKKAKKLVARYAECAELKKRIEDKAKADAADLGVEMAQIEQELKAYAEVHRAEVPQGVKFLTVGTARLGWQLNPGKLEYSETINQARLMQEINTHLPHALKTQIDDAVMKSKLKTDEGFAKLMAKVGVKLVTTERFYVKIDG